ncbi:hypothetical protein ABZZ16_27970 [Streptomyces sp. NPDC006386]|uniref:hypothetical protein n=1 Tax=unclassified Streptomyces TaxID=2593676 RepID=UPI0033AD4291
MTSSWTATTRPSARAPTAARTASPTGGAPWRIEARAGSGGGLGYAVSAWDLRPYTVRSLAGAGSGPADAGLVRP